MKFVEQYRTTEMEGMSMGIFCEILPLKSVGFETG